MGLVACPKCEKPNVSRASYCVYCGHSVETAVRMSPAGAGAGAAGRGQTRPNQRDARDSGRSREPRAPAPADLRRSETRAEPLRPATAPDARAEANGSGSPKAQLPAALRGFNWAAFLLGPIWGLGNAALPAILIGLASGIIPWFTRTSMPWVGYAVWLGANLFVGYKANEWAWRSRKWASAEQFRRTQQAWLLWAVIASVIVMIVFSIFLRRPEA